MDAAEIDLAITELEERLEKLRVLYDQYFSGIERFEPTRRREEVERRLKTLRRENIRNTGQRFKFQQVVQRFTTFSQYWTRILREIEKGTFKRDLAKAAKRFGAKPTSKRSTEVNLAEEETAKPIEEEPEELDSSWIEEEPEEENTSPFRRTDPGVLEPVVQRVAPPSAPPARVAAPSRPVVPSTPSPEPVPASVSVAPVSPAPAPAPVVPAPPSKPSIPAPTPSVPAPPKRPAAAHTRLELDDDDELLGGASGARVPFRPPAPTTRPAAPSRPTPAASVAPAAPVPPPPIRPPTPSVPSVAPPAQAAPVAASSAPPSARPEPAAPARPAVHPQSPVARPQPVAKSSEDLNEMRMREIYNRYVEAKRKCNESTAAITYDGLARSLRDSVPKLQQKHGGRVVDFEVVIKDGRTVLKPVVKGTLARPLVPLLRARPG